MAPSPIVDTVARTLAHVAYRRRANLVQTERRRRLRTQQAMQYNGDCVCTHEGAIRPQCMAGIFGVDCGTHVEYTNTGCEFDTLTLLEKRPTHREIEERELRAGRWASYKRSHQRRKP